MIFDLSIEIIKKRTGWIKMKNRLQGKLKTQTQTLMTVLLVLLNVVIIVSFPMHLLPLEGENIATSGQVDSSLERGATSNSKPFTTSVVDSPSSDDVNSPSQISNILIYTRDEHSTAFCHP